MGLVSSAWVGAGGDRRRFWEWLHRYGYGNSPATMTWRPSQQSDDRSFYQLCLAGAMLRSSCASIGQRFLGEAHRLTSTSVEQRLGRAGLRRRALRRAAHCWRNASVEQRFSAALRNRQKSALAAEVPMGKPLRTITPQGTYFITSSCYMKQQLLQTDRMASLCGSLTSLPNSGKLSVARFCGYARSLSFVDYTSGRHNAGTRHAINQGRIFIQGQTGVGFQG
jgi:hypothetical protein